MKIESQRFISLSNLFDGLDQLLEAWRDSNHDDFTFGEGEDDAAYAEDEQL